MNKTYIMVTGPAASGKSTLCKNLTETLPAYFYKPSYAYFELANKHNIPKEKMFELVPPEEAVNHFCDVCQKHLITLGDQHLAIQPKRDSAIATNSTTDIDVKEPYTKALDYALFDKLNYFGIEPIIIYLKANPEILFERAHKRHIETGFVLRNKTKEEVIDEILAEEYYFNELITKKHLENFIINTESLNEEHTHLLVKKRILERKK